MCWCFLTTDLRPSSELLHPKGNQFTMQSVSLVSDPSNSVHGDWRRRRFSSESSGPWPPMGQGQGYGGGVAFWGSCPDISHPPASLRLSVALQLGRWSPRTRSLKECLVSPAYEVRQCPGPQGMERNEDFTQSFLRAALGRHVPDKARFRLTGWRWAKTVVSLGRSM